MLMAGEVIAALDLIQAEDNLRSATIALFKHLRESDISECDAQSATAFGDAAKQHAFISCLSAHDLRAQGR
jgi:hypothetical protein